MNSAQFFSLPINRNTVSMLRQEEIFFSNPAFYSEIIQCINSYLSLPVLVKKAIMKPTIKSIYDSLVEVKKAGYREELILQF